MEKNYPNGPALEVECRLVEQGIAGVVLRPRGGKGMHASFILEDSKAKRHLEALEAWLAQYAEGQQPSITLPFVSVPMAPYTSKVLLKLLPTLPFGQTISYRELASRCGNPNAYRAAGSACGRNPWPLLVPCHRILASDQRLGGFTGGLEVKRRLLRFEGISFQS